MRREERKRTSVVKVGGGGIREVKRPSTLISIKLMILVTALTIILMMYTTSLDAGSDTGTIVDLM